MIGLILIIIASVSPCDAPKHPAIVAGEREAICRYIEVPKHHRRR